MLESSGGSGRLLHMCRGCDVTPQAYSSRTVFSIRCGCWACWSVLHWSYSTSIIVHRQEDTRLSISALQHRKRQQQDRVLGWKKGRDMCVW